MFGILARCIRRVLVALLAAVAFVAAVALGTASADVAPTPVTTPCPAHYQRLSVAWFEAAGPYLIPRAVDTAGNNNGYVCAFPLPDAARDADCRSGGVIACELEGLGLPLYRFSDDDNPASQRAQAGG